MKPIRKIEVINFGFLDQIKNLPWASMGNKAMKWGGIGAGIGAAGGAIEAGLSDDPEKTMLGGAMKGAAYGGLIGAGAGAGSRVIKHGSRQGWFGSASKTRTPMQIADRAAMRDTEEATRRMMQKPQSELQSNPRNIVELSEFLSRAITMSVK